METELKSLRIDRTARRPRQAKPFGKVAVGTIVAVAVLAVAIFAYKKLTAATPVQTVQVQARRGLLRCNEYLARHGVNRRAAK